MISVDHARHNSRLESRWTFARETLDDKLLRKIHAPFVIYLMSPPDDWHLIPRSNVTYHYSSKGYLMVLTA